MRGHAVKLATAVPTIYVLETLLFCRQCYRFCYSEAVRAV
jgi:hypothetical protein